MEKKWTYCAVYSIIQIHFVRGKASSCPFLSNRLPEGGTWGLCSFKMPVTAAEIEHQRQIVTKIFSYVFKWQLWEGC